MLIPELHKYLLYKSGEAVSYAALFVLQAPLTRWKELRISSYSCLMGPN